VIAPRSGAAVGVLEGSRTEEESAAAGIDLRLEHPPRPRSQPRPACPLALRGGDSRATGTPASGNRG